MKKQIRTIFKGKEHLLDELPVEELVAYCQNLEDEVVELNYQLSNNKEIVLKEMISDILKSCNGVQKEQQEHLRFGYPPVDFEKAIANLKSYIQIRCKDHKIWID